MPLNVNNTLLMILSSLILMVLIGDKKVVSPPYKTKVNVVLVGLSVLLEVLKVFTSLKLENQSKCPNNISSIVPKMEITDVREVLKFMLINTPKITVSPPKLLILISLEPPEKEVNVNKLLPQIWYSKILAASNYKKIILNK